MTRKEELEAEYRALWKNNRIIKGKTAERLDRIVKEWTDIVRGKDGENKISK